MYNRISDGILGGSCEVNIDCDDNNAICDSSTPKVCVCKDGYRDIDDTCEEGNDISTAMASTANYM